MARRVLTAHVPAALAKQVAALAQRLDRPRGWIMKAALERYLARERLRHEMTLEALVEVDEGKTLPHVDVRRWVDSLPPGRRKAR